MIKSLGFSNTNLREKFNLFFIVKYCNINYKKPAKLEDELIVFTSVVSLSKTSLVMKQDVKRHDDLVAEAEVCLVAVNMKGKPTKIPEELKKLF